MKNNYIGVIRKLDSIGRITLVKEYLEFLNIQNKDKVCIYDKDNKIIIAKDQNLNLGEISDIRKVDNVGRVVVPKEIREKLRLIDKYSMLLTPNYIEVKVI